jgi:hypothetical protein
MVAITRPVCRCSDIFSEDKSCVQVLIADETVDVVLKN